MEFVPDLHFNYNIRDLALNILSTHLNIHPVHSGSCTKKDHVQKKIMYEKKIMYKKRYIGNL